MPGYGLDKDELIESSKRIALVKAHIEACSEAYCSEKESYKRINFEIIEILKDEEVGDSELYLDGFKSTISYYVYDKNHFKSHSNHHFNNHTDKSFWNMDVGRYIPSNTAACYCYCKFTFIEGENYLVFPDKSGADMSAEIIPSQDDKWYLYVKQKISHNKSLHTDAQKAARP